MFVCVGNPGLVLVDAGDADAWPELSSIGQPFDVARSHSNKRAGANALAANHDNILAEDCRTAKATKATSGSVTRKAGCSLGDRPSALTRPTLLRPVLKQSLWEVVLVLVQLGSWGRDTAWDG